MKQSFSMLGLVVMFVCLFSGFAFATGDPIADMFASIGITVLAAAVLALIIGFLAVDILFPAARRARRAMK
jgi:hypothetical protein